MPLRLKNSTLNILDLNGPGWRTVWLADPDGRIIEISQGFTDQENPPPLEDEGKSIISRFESSKTKREKGKEEVEL